MRDRVGDELVELLGVDHAAGEQRRAARRAWSDSIFSQTVAWGSSIVLAMNEQQHGHEEGTAAWHRRLHHTGRDRLSEETAQTPGMRRYEAISGTRNGSRKIWMGESHIGPGMVSGDHHHGEAETGIYRLLAELSAEEAR